MERGKQPSSSFISDLFGDKDSSAAASSSGIFGSISPPSKIIGDGSLLHSSDPGKKQDSESKVLSAKTGVSGGEGQSQSMTNKDTNPYNQEEKAQPCPYSSSIFYGARDFYSRPQSAPNTCFTTFNKDGGEDDSGSASRGNWWKESVEY